MIIFQIFLNVSLFKKNVEVIDMQEVDCKPVL